jgi:hypothetical protein
MERAVQSDNPLRRHGGNPLIVEPGKLHNAILAEMNDDGIFTSGERLKEEEFIARIVESSNSVFRTNNIELQVGEDDIREALQCFESKRERGEFDVFSSVEYRRVGDAIHLLDHLAYAGEGHDLEELRKIRMAFEELEGITISDCSGETLRKIVNNYKSKDFFSESYWALSILEDSFDFWSSLKKSETEEIVAARVIVDEGTYDPKLTIDWYSISILLWDAVGAITCWPLGPFSIICAVVASSAFIVATSRE